MEEKLSQYPTFTVPTVQAARQVDGEAALQATRYRSTAIFFTVVLTAAIVVGGLIGAAIIFRSGSGEAVGCPTVAPRNKLSDRDQSKVEQLQKEDGERLPERITYDQAANTVIIDSPANVNQNNSAATYAIDFDRRVVFMSIHDQDMCLGFPLQDDMANQIQEYLNDNDGTVVDLASVQFDIWNLNDMGEIPADYVQAANGPIIRGLCAGRTTHWAVPHTAEDQDRQKRGMYLCGYIGTTCGCCICTHWFLCHAL